MLHSRSAGAGSMTWEGGTEARCGVVNTLDAVQSNSTIEGE